MTLFALSVAARTFAFFRLTSLPSHHHHTCLDLPIMSITDPIRPATITSVLVPDPPPHPIANRHHHTTRLWACAKAGHCRPDRARLGPACPANVAVQNWCRLPMRRAKEPNKTNGI
ncbi:hypothetical protein IWX49DRAFT_555927 [Phyllosticta citricarpa]